MKGPEPKIKPYLKKLDYSYAFGTYPTLDLLKHKREHVLKVLLNTKGEDSPGITDIIDICSKNGVNLEYNDNSISKISHKENTYSVGVFKKYDSELDDSASHIVLVEPRNMGNIGTIIRTMLAFGLEDLAIIRPAADIFDPMVIRSAMGAMFQVNFKYYDSILHYMDAHPTHSYYPFMVHKGRDIKQVAVDPKYSLIFGNESQGLTTDFSEIGQPVFIKQSDKVDSLNLSIAAGVAMWYFASIVRKVY